jgi:putative transferase (TIGR04331 family)
VVERLLVTTALQETWPEKGVPVLFIGEWCRLYERKSAWEHRDALVAPYHWDDRKKLYQDYDYLTKLYEELLSELAAQLSELHCVKHSLRYWRILIGPWLGYFIQMLFDRWFMLHQVLRDDDISGVRVLTHLEHEYVPNDMAAFSNLFITDEWNETIYSQILERLGIPIERLALKKQVPFSVGNRIRQSSPYLVLKRGLARAASNLSGILCRDDEYFFISTCISIKLDFQLQARLGQLPKLWRSVAGPESEFDLAARQWQLPSAENNDEFSNLVRAMLPRHIPKVYLEGYPALVSLTNDLPWPKRPRAIFTSNSFSTDDVFKAWAANKVEGGTPLVIGQHGGNYGMALWSFIEDHEIAIANKFLTWGWSSPKEKKVTPIGNFKGFGKRSQSEKKGFAILVEAAFPRQSYHMYSVPVSAGQWMDYFSDQCRFVEALPKNLQNQLLVRLYPQDYGLGQKKRWRERFPDLQLETGVQTMESLLKKTRIYISTYNATTYLESLSMNFPTIIFWNPKHWELRQSVCPYFEKLKSVGIFHETPEGAARQMSLIWDDVHSWWHAKEVQAARKEFCERYARIPERPLDQMVSLFREIVEE